MYKNGKEEVLVWYSGLRKCGQVATWACVQSLGWDRNIISPFYFLNLKGKTNNNRRSKIGGDWSSRFGSAVTNRTSIHEDVGFIPGLAQWVKDPALL